MPDIRTEYFVRINPRRKGDYGYWIESEYFDSAEEKEKYYAKKCKEIKNNLEEHYKDYEIKDIEIADTSREVELEDRIDKLEAQVKCAKYYLDILQQGADLAGVGANGGAVPLDSTEIAELAMKEIEEYEHD